MKILGYKLHSSNLDFDPFDLSVLEGLRNVFGGIKMAMTSLENNNQPSAETSIKNINISLSLNNKENPLLSELSSSIALNSNIQSLNTPSAHTPVSTNLLDSYPLERTEEVLTDLDQINMKNDSDYTKDENAMRNLGSSKTLLESTSSPNIIINNTKNENEKNTKTVYNSRIWIPSNPKSITKNLGDESDDTKEKKNGKKNVSWPLKSNSFTTGNEFYIDNDVYNDINNIENNTVNLERNLNENDNGNDDYNYETQDDNDESSIDDNMYDNDREMLLMRTADVNINPDEIAHMKLMDRLKLFPLENNNADNFYPEYVSGPEMYDESSLFDELDDSDYEESAYSPAFNLADLSPSAQSQGVGTSRRRRMGRGSREETSSNLDALLSLSNFNSYNLSKEGVADDIITPSLISQYSTSSKEALSTTLKDSNPPQGLDTDKGKIESSNLSSTEVASESTNALSEEAKRANLKLNMRRIEQIELLTSKRKDRS
jgi:hypothetical protein